jgi:tRNA modification GTPase
MNAPNDLICAIATSSGIGALSIIRVSGPKSKCMLLSHFSKNLSEAVSHSIHFGLLSDSDGRALDEVLVAVFDQNKSFTGEESIEISCHGSPYIQQEILHLLCTLGARMAEPGEFTQRAFLNGKMDLSQAEAVADLIASESKHAHQIALQQLRGHFSNELRTLREELIHFASLIELELDFAEEDVEFADRGQLLALVDKALKILERLAESFALGNAIKNGVPVALVGAPNTGKSTLLNQLLGEDRAIVSPIAGTTRDVIEETLNIEGILVRLIDTAGIRETTETIEAMGIARSMQKIEQAQIVLCMADAEDTQSLVDTENWIQGLKIQYPEKHLILLVNKSDLNPTIQTTGLLVSAKNGEGISELKAHLRHLVLGHFDLQTDTIVSNARHHEALVKTANIVALAKQGLQAGTSGDFIAMDIRQAMFHLGTITGDISTDDLLANIFSKFCIGK